MANNLELATNNLEHFGRVYGLRLHYFEQNK